MTDACTEFARDQYRDNNGEQLMDARICTECRQLSPSYYHVDPRTSAVVSDRVWCRGCYELIRARTAREEARGNHTEAQ